MKKAGLSTLAAVFLMMIALSPAGAWEQKRIKCKNPEAQKLADQLYELMSKDVSKKAYGKAIGLMEKAVKIEPDNDELWVELSGDYWEYGDKLPKETAEQKKIRIEWFTKGIEASEKAMEIKKSAGAHFWYATNLAARGEMKGIIQSVPLFPTLVKHMNRCDELDPDYLLGGTARFWSEVITRVPNLALRLAGMSKEAAINDLKNVIKKNPLYFNNRIFYARYLMRLDEKKGAMEQLEFVLSHDPKETDNPTLHSQNIIDQVEARKMWIEITGKPYCQR